jgi:hypothetical protein
MMTAMVSRMSCPSTSRALTSDVRSARAGVSIKLAMDPTRWRQVSRATSCAAHTVGRMWLQHDDSCRWRGGAQFGHVGAHSARHRLEPVSRSKCLEAASSRAYTVEHSSRLAGRFHTVTLAPFQAAPRRSMESPCPPTRCTRQWASRSAYSCCNMSDYVDRVALSWDASARRSCSRRHRADDHVFDGDIRRGRVVSLFE